MNATSIQRIIPAKSHKAVSVTMDSDRGMTVKLANGETFRLAKEEKELQAFVIWTMVNSECTA